MAATFDAKSASQGGLHSTSSVTLAHTVAADATMLVVMVPLWLAANTVTGVTWNGSAMTLLGSAGFSNALDNVYVFFMAGPATGAHNIVVSINNTLGDEGSVFGVSFKGTPTSGGTGVVWADFTSTKTASAAANSSISVPNNTSNDALVDCVADGGGTTPVMVTQTNRTLGSSGNANGEGTAWSYLVPGPAGSQTMNWTFASTSSAQAGARVLGVAAAGLPPGKAVLVRQAVKRAAHY